MSRDASRAWKLVQGGLAAMGLAACSPAPVQTTAAEPTPSTVELSNPAAAELYEQSCAMCHFDGRDSLAAPALIGSAMVGAPDPTRFIDVTLHGLNNTSVVNGKKFGGIMPPTAGLTDEEVAAVVNYVRQTYGGAKGNVTPAQVAARR